MSKRRLVWVAGAVPWLAFLASQSALAAPGPSIPTGSGMPALAFKGNEKEFVASTPVEGTFAPTQGNSVQGQSAPAAPPAAYVLLALGLLGASGGFFVKRKDPTRVG